MEKIVSGVQSKNSAVEASAASSNIEKTDNFYLNRISASGIIGSESSQDFNVESIPEIINTNFLGTQYRLANNWFNHVNVIDYKYKAINYLEIGVFYGANILSVAKTYGLHHDSKLYCIDPWEDYDDYTEYKNHISSVYDYFINNIENAGVKDKIIINRGFSNTEVSKFQDFFFDIIYIDGNHEPEYVLEDAVLSFRKLKYNGIMIFDDYGYDGPDFTQRGIDAFISGYRDRIHVLGEQQSQVFIQKKEVTRSYDYKDELKYDLTSNSALSAQNSSIESVMKEANVQNSFKNHPYFTHQPFFIEILKNTSGNILELGCGEGSTLMIREMIKNTKRKLVSLESDLTWLNKYIHLSDGTHKLYHVNASNDDTVETGNIWVDFIKSMQLHDFEIVFIDSSPWSSRTSTFYHFLDKVKIIIMHDFDFFPINNIIGNVVSREIKDGKVKIDCDLNGVVKNYKLFYPPFDYFVGSTGPATLVCSNTMGHNEFQILISNLENNVRNYYN